MPENDVGVGEGTLADRFRFMTHNAITWNTAKDLREVDRQVAQSLVSVRLNPLQGERERCGP